MCLHEEIFNKQNLCKVFYARYFAINVQPSNVEYNFAKSKDDIQNFLWQNNLDFLSIGLNTVLYIGTH
jgi:hypothetical protein